MVADTALRCAGGDGTISGSQAVSIKSAACAVVMCLASSAALAQPAPMAGPMAALGPVLPPQEIGRILRTHGLVPQATPVRNGEAYQVRAVDRIGRQVRVAVDARYGDILMLRPIAMSPGAYGPYGPPVAGYYGGPPPGTVGAYPPAPGVRPTPPPPQHAALTPVHPPIPRPKPAAKPAAVTPAPAPEAAAPAAPAPAATPAAAAGGDAPGAPPAPPAAAPSSPAAAPAIPPVAPLD
jgi:hypothetical protein